MLKSMEVSLLMLESHSQQLTAKTRRPDNECKHPRSMLRVHAPHMTIVWAQEGGEVAGLGTTSLSSWQHTVVLWEMAATRQLLQASKQAGTGHDQQTLAAAGGRRQAAGNWHAMTRRAARRIHRNHAPVRCVWNVVRVTKACQGDFKMMCAPSQRGLSYPQPTSL